MAMSLNEGTFGNLIDYLGGYDDLKKGVIKILHPLSFVDDPTRIIRALKFSVRFGYGLDDFTLHLQKECLRNGLFDGLGGERIKSEIKQTLNLNMPECYDRLLSDGIYRLIYQHIKPQSKTLASGATISKIINKHIAHIKNNDLIWLIYLGCLFADLDSDEVSAIIKKLNLNSVETKILISGNTILKKKDSLLNMQTLFEVYEFFECHFTESILMALAVTQDETITYYIEKYLNELQFETINTTGKTLIDKGFHPGPEFGYILRDILKEKINGNIKTKEDEAEFLSTISQANYIE
jgi:tRNA nucleotidyltransferase/poly(A) polymerase